MKPQWQVSHLVAKSLPITVVTLAWHVCLQAAAACKPQARRGMHHNNTHTSQWCFAMIMLYSSAFNMRQSKHWSKSTFHDFMPDV